MLKIGKNNLEVSEREFTNALEPIFDEDHDAKIRSELPITILEKSKSLKSELISTHGHVLQPF